MHFYPLNLHSLRCNKCLSGNTYTIFRKMHDLDYSVVDNSFWSKTWQNPHFWPSIQRRKFPVFFNFFDKFEGQENWNFLSQAYSNFSASPWQNVLLRSKNVVQFVKMIGWIRFFWVYILQMWPDLYQNRSQSAIFSTKKRIFFSDQ